jgi:L,D-transpeptidase YcbB
MTLIGAPRRAALLAGVALLALAPAPLWASAPDGVAVEATETAPAPVETAPVERAEAPAAQPPSAPEAVVAAPSEPDATSSAPVALPEVPGAPVAITGNDRLPGALAARLAETQKSLHPRLSRKEREAIAAFYALGNYQPLWVTNGAWNAAGEAIVARLKAADEDGLNASDYAVPTPALAGSDGDGLEAELKLSAAAVVYARDARGGRIEPSRLSNLITPDLELPAADKVLTSLAAASDAVAALAAYHPPHAGYHALKAKLAEARVNPAAPARLEGDIVANMERWRWLPSDMGRRHVFVNVPEYKLRLMRDGRPMHEARVVVGKPETPTPLFSDEMDHAVVNPSWYVPESIFKNEFHSDPALAAAKGYDVVYGKNGNVTIRQPPGERNALGFVKFMFPNKHAVYLHDTPSRRLFANEKRAFSHGCVRLDQPFRFGEFVLGSEWTETRLRSLIGKGERTIRLPEKIPVHLAYFTLSVDDKGEMRSFADIYGVNNKVRGALGLSREATPVAEAPRGRKIARAQTAPAPARRKVVRPVQTVRAAPPPAAGQSFFWWVR